MSALFGRRDPAVIDFFARDLEVAYGLVAAGGLLKRRALRGAGAVMLAAGAALARDVARSPSVPGANDNASGVAALLRLVERFAREPLEGTEVVALSVGCEESGMGGMADWLRRRGTLLDPETTLVLGLDTLGSGEPIVLRGEGRPGAVPYRAADLDLVDRGADHADLPRPRRFKIGAWTDPALAVYAGLPAVSILSVRDGHFTEYHLPSDVPENVDWDSVARCTRLAAATAEEWAAS